MINWNALAGLPSFMPCAPAIGVEMQDDWCFGTVLQTPRFLRIDICNLGDADLIIARIARIAGPSCFDVAGAPATPVTIRPGEHVEYALRFTPLVRGVHQESTFRIVSNDPVKPRFDLKASGRLGMGEEPAGRAPSGTVAVTGSTYFGAVERGSASKAVSIGNVGGCALHVSRVAFSSPRRNFKLRDNPFPATLLPGGSLDVVVEYRACCEPEGCVLVIESDDPRCPVKMRDVVAYTQCTSADADEVPDHLCANIARGHPVHRGGG